VKRRAYYLALSGFLSTFISLVAVAQESTAIQSALTARVNFTDLNGSQLQKLPRGKPFNITVTIDNTVGNEPPAGLNLSGWLRGKSQHNLDCQSAARAYRATGRTPVGSVDLNGPVIGVLTEEGHLTVADPELDLASANLIAATSFDEQPAAFTTDPDTNRFLVSLGSTGKVLAVNAFGGETKTIADNLNTPGQLIPAGLGAVWVLEKGSGDLLHLEGKKIRKRLPLNASFISEGANGFSFVAWNKSEVHVIDRLTGDPLINVVQVPDQKIIIDKYTDNEAPEVDSIASLVDVISIEDHRSAFAVAALTRSGVSMYYLDDLARAIHIKLSTPAQRLAVDLSGRYLFAYAPEGGDTFIIDIARSRVVQVVGAGAPVINIEFTENAAFLMLADQSMVGVIELASIKAGQHAKVREVALGQATPRENSLEKKLLASLTPRNEILAVHAKSFTGFIVHESSAMGDAPPMSAIKLRGGIPQQIAVIDRSFREVSTAKFRTTATLPAMGQFELVVTTGIGSLSACLPINVEGSSYAINDQNPGTISIVKVSTDNETTLGARLRLQKADGEPAQKVRAEVTFSALEANWIFRANLLTDHDGISRSSYDLPALGEYVITVSTGNEREFQPLLYRVK